MLIAARVQISHQNSHAQTIQKKCLAVRLSITMYNMERLLTNYGQRGLSVLEATYSVRASTFFLTRFYFQHHIWPPSSNHCSRSTKEMIKFTFETSRKRI